MTNKNFQHSPPCGFVLWANKKEEKKKKRTKHDGLTAEEFMRLQSLRAPATQLHLYFNGPI